MATITVTTSAGLASYEVSTGARGPAGADGVAGADGSDATVTAANIIAALNVPSYATMTAANTALAIGKIFYNTTALELQVTTA